MANFLLAFFGIPFVLGCLAIIELATYALIVTICEYAGWSRAEKLLRAWNEKTSIH